MGSPDQDRESYFRWQEFAIRQLGYVINLMMTLSGGALAFAIREKIEGYVKLDGCAWRLAVLSLAISVIAAVAANVTRALDFRYTRRAARARMKDGKDHEELHETAERLGAWTWGLFYFQAATFALGPLCLVWWLSPFLFK